MPIVLTKPSAGGFLSSAEIRANMQALANAVGQTNLILDPRFDVWGAGDAAAPSRWTLFGTGAAVAKTGTGQADTSRKVGKYAAKVTAPAGNAAGLRQLPLTTTSYDDGFDGLFVAAGCWVKCSSANKAAIYLNDGVNGAPNGVGGSIFHPGDGSWQWLTCVLQLDAAATKIELNLEVGTSANAVFSGATLLIGDTHPQFHVPRPTVYGALLLDDWPVGVLDRFGGAAGNVSTGWSTLRSFAVPAGFWDGEGRALSVEYTGDFANNANSKDVRIGIGGTVLVTGGAGAHTAGFSGKLVLWRKDANTLAWASRITMAAQFTQGSVTGLTFANALTLLLEGNSDTASNDVVLWGWSVLGR